MSMKMTRIFGLNEWAKNFVKGKQVFVCTENITRVYPDGRQETLKSRSVYELSVRKKESGEFYTGFFDNEDYPLYEYTFLDGSVYREKIQQVICTSLLIVFLALQDEKGNWVLESLWP